MLTSYDLENIRVVLTKIIRAGKKGRIAASFNVQDKYKIQALELTLEHVTALLDKVAILRRNNRGKILPLKRNTQEGEKR